MFLRWVYSAIFYLAQPFLVYRLYQRAKKNPAYKDRIPERFGKYNVPVQEKSLWVHTVSVGEFIAAQPLIEQLLQRHPEIPLVVTTMTPTGSERVKAALGDRVIHVYLPYDIPYAVKRFLRHFNPLALVIMETELWPNLIHYTSQRGAPVILANARLSQKSADGYRKAAMLVRPMLREISIIAAQAKADGERFIELGLPPACLKVTGTVKFDLSVDDTVMARARELRRQWGENRPVVIAASTHEGEDEQVLEAFKLVQSELENALLVLVPRHPERFDTAAELVEQQGWVFARHSQSQPVTAETEVIIGDTMGELLILLGASDVAFIGGSLEPVGGHNMLEALAVATPAITGPHVFNFGMVAQLLTELNVLETVSTPVGLGEAVLRLLKDPAQRKALSEKGLRVVEENRGAINRLVGILEKYLPT
ncbi:MAG: lipid IV(A) 3-deoxy-D-manno-octulosonic acid transferase [Ketobacteraceae bacterium]|nr:lipid IV(A) 3-deoxy-D-manno-octulosonic acid transferase [Ketobacteraceae bacterium]